ncbi:MAG: hypothetical protein ACK4EY_16290 [Flavipsychrobacter sp.]
MASNSRLTKADIRIGMKVEYKAPEATLALITEVITAPRQINKEWCVNIAQYGNPVPISQLKKHKQ